MATGRKPKSRKQSRQTPGWIWMLFGLSLGLVVAAAIYFGDRRAPLPAPATASTAGQRASEPVPAQPVVDAPSDPAPAAEEPAPSARFDFYDMLPQFEVVIPEVETSAARVTRATAVEEPGSYVIQTGSFRELADADRMQANLALLGIESRVQRVAIDEDTYHRVRVGPTEDLAELNQIRRRLWDAEIEFLLIQVPN